MNSLYHPTDLNVWYDTTPTWSGPGETDVVYQEGATGIPAGAVGMTWCNDPQNGTNHKCDQFYIRIRGAGGYGRITAGHETGHAIGLAHPSWGSPPRGPCKKMYQIMREYYSCIDTAKLGNMLTNNINWVY